MMLTKAQVDDIKKEITIIEFKFDDPKTIAIDEIFKKVNRTMYETSLLFYFSYNFLRRIRSDHLEKIVKDCWAVGTARGFFDEVIRYPSQVIKNPSDMRFRIVLSDHLDFIEDVINLVFVDLISQNEKEDNLFAEIKKLKE